MLQEINEVWDVVLILENYVMKKIDITESR